LEGYDRNPAAALTLQATKVEMADWGNLAYILAFDRDGNLYVSNFEQRG
jgi:hypothetical protein